MKRSQWGKLTLALLLAAYALIIGLVVLVDPFEIYRQATAYIPPITNGTQNYSNAGIAKSYDYDSVIIGSSMTENFTPSQLDSLLGGSFVKLPINGGTPFNNRQMLEMAFGTHDVKRVFYGVDIESLTWFYTTPKCEMPDYLYDDNLFNDAAYWFNSSVLIKYIPAALKTLGQSDPALRDKMYNWGDLYEYGRHAALRDVTITADVYAQHTNADDPIVLSQQSKLNVEYNYIPFLQEHPDTEFIFFFSPYSLAHWYSFYKSGAFEYHLNQKAALVQALLPYENVKIYDFQAELDWILNLDNYIDSSHYGPWINDAMVEAVTRDDHRISSLDDILKNNQVLREHVDYLVSCGAWPDDFSAAGANNN
ncbi:MAG: hypothetical protein IJ313_05575 [Clostridia bacterium]|nr:hypothetical protein [Clostridia bacterium]